MQEQQQEAGSRQVLQLPGPEEAAGGGAGPGGALQRHRSHGRASIPRHLKQRPRLVGLYLFQQRTKKMFQIKK